MTTQQIYLFGGCYLILFVVVVVVTHATTRRIGGALVGGLVDGGALLCIVALGERAGWWHQVITWQPYFLALLVISSAPCGFVFLITWRIARRFGGRGLTAAMIFAAIIGPPRDYWYMAQFPEWGVYNWSLPTVLAVSAAYVLLGILGHGAMRLVAGPARDDRLARWPWEAAQPAAEKPCA